MFTLLSLKTEAFGLDISDLSVKVINLKKRGKFLRVASFNQVDVPVGIIKEGVIADEDVLAKIIKDACKNVRGKRIATKYVIASLPEEKSFLQVIQMPKMKEEELTSAIMFQAENYIPLPISEVYLDFQTIVPMHDEFDHLDVLIVAIPKKIVNSYVSCLKKAGLIPLIFEVESQAVTRALIKNELSPSPIVIIDFGKTSTDFIVFSGRSIRFTYSIPISSQQITTAIAEALAISPEKAEAIKLKFDITKAKDQKSKQILEAINPLLKDLLTQIKKYITFYQDHTSHEHLASSGKVEKIILCGGGTNLKGLPEFLSENLHIPTELGNFWTNVALKKNQNEIQKDALLYVTALGLAQRGMQNSK